MNGRYIPSQYILPIREINKLPSNESFTLLDIGAGIRDLKELLPSNIKYVSIDYTENVKHNLVLDLDIGSDGMGHIPITSNSFDIVVCLETLEHLLSPEKTLKEIVRITKPSGTMFISMPNEYNFWLRIQYLFGIKDAMKEPFLIADRHLHIHLPRVKDIRDLLGKYMRIDRIYYGWNSYRAPKFLNGFISIFSRIWPSMFTRIVVVKGSKLVTTRK